MREQAAILSTILVIVGTLWYIYLIRKNKIKPVLAGWMISFSGTTLSFLTYCTTGKPSIVNNIYNFSSMITITWITWVTWRKFLRDKEVWYPEPFPKWCLRISGMIAVFWAVLVWGFHRTGFWPNIMLQFMMAVGYLVMIHRLLTTKENTESRFSWFCVVLASGSGMVTAWISGDLLASIFAGRTCAGAFAILLVSQHFERRSQFFK